MYSNFAYSYILENSDVLLLVNVTIYNNKSKAKGMNKKLTWELSTQACFLLLLWIFKRYEPSIWKWTAGKEKTCILCNIITLGWFFSVSRNFRREKRSRVETYTGITTNFCLVFKLIHFFHVLVNSQSVGKNKNQ